MTQLGLSTFIFKRSNSNQNFWVCNDVHRLGDHPMWKNLNFRIFTSWVLFLHCLFDSDSATSNVRSFWKFLLKVVKSVENPFFGIRLKTTYLGNQRVDADCWFSNAFLAISQKAVISCLSVDIYVFKSWESSLWE